MTDLDPEAHLDIFLRVHRTVGVRLTQMFAEAGVVPPSEARVLTLIARAPSRRLRIDELSQDMRMTKGAVSRIVNRLESDGYVERQTSGPDRRAVYAVITSEGRNALRRVAVVFRSAFQDVFLAGLTREELDQMSRLLEKLDRANDSGRPSISALRAVE